MAAPFQGPFSIQVQSWVYNTRIAFNRERQEWERGNHRETKEELGDAGLEGDGVGPGGLGHPGGSVGWLWCTSDPWDAAPSEVAGAYYSNSDSHSWWGEPGLDNLISLFHL